MKVFDSLKKKAEESKKVIVFPEGNDDRIIKAAVRLEKEGIVKPLLLGKPDEVIETAQSLNVDLGSIEIINPAVYPDFEKMCHAEKEDLIAIDGIGEVIADTLIQYFEKKENIRKVLH